MTRTLVSTLLAGLAALLATLAAAPVPVAAAPPIAYWREATAGLGVNGSYDAVVGDFAGGAQDDIFWNSNDGDADHLWTSRNDATFSSARVSVVPPVGAVPVVGDFGGDAHEDILWYGRGSAPDALWLSNGASFRPLAVTINGDYGVQTLDNATGRDQVLFYARAAGRATTWVFAVDGSHVSRSAAAPANGLVLVGRFSADGCADVYFYARTGADPLWELDCAGTARAVRSMTETRALEPVVGQFSPGRDAQDDIVWIDPTGARTTLAENLTGGAFTVSRASLPTDGHLLRTANGYATVHSWDTRTGGHRIWFKVPGGADFNAELSNTVVPPSYEPVVGRFVGTGEDIFWYSPGGAAERLFWQVG